MLPFPLHLQGFLLCVCSFSRVPVLTRASTGHMPKTAKESFAFWGRDREEGQLAIYPHHRLLRSLSDSPPAYSAREPEDGMFPELRGSFKKCGVHQQARTVPLGTLLTIISLQNIQPRALRGV